MTPSTTVWSPIVTTGAASLSSILPVPSRSLVTPIFPAVSVRLTSKSSNVVAPPSKTLSSTVVTEIVFDVSPAKNVIVPLFVS